MNAGILPLSSTPRRLLKTRNDAPIVLFLIFLSSNDSDELPCRREQKTLATKDSIKYKCHFSILLHYSLPLTLLDMISQVSNADFNTDVLHDKCVCKSNNIDYYKILSLGRNCNDTEIKEA